MDTTTTEGRDPTGRQLLAAALTHPDRVRSRQLTWRALGAAEKPVVTALTQTLLKTLPRTGALLSDHDRAELAWDVFAAVKRALIISPNTLKALAKGTPSPVHGSERAEIAAAARRKLTTGGFTVGEADSRTLAYTLADLVSSALAEIADVPVEPVRLGAVTPTRGPVLDHDYFDWRTGQPLFAVPTPAATTIAA